MAGARLTMAERHRLHREVLYNAAVDCITRGCKHKNKIECTDAWFAAMRDAGPRRPTKERK